MRANGETPMGKQVPPRFSWGDAAILGGALLALLIGVSLLNFQAATVLGIAAMLFVIYKLFTTKP